MSKQINALLIGLPNVGKTTIFNEITNSIARTGNFSGTTVGILSKIINFNNSKINIMDTPGILDLYKQGDNPLTDDIVIKNILDKGYDIIINVISVDSLYSSLKLTMQLTDLGMPLLNIISVPKNYDKSAINLPNLKSLLGSSCVIIEDLKSKNIELIKKEIISNVDYIVNPKLFYGLAIENKLKNLTDKKDRYNFIKEERKKSEVIIEKIDKFCNKIIKIAFKDSNNVNSSYKVTNFLDKFLLNPFLGSLIFLLIMYLFFFIVISFSGVFIDFFDTLSGIIFVNIPTLILAKIHTPNTILLFVKSIGSTVQILSSFIPILFIFYFCLGFLENSGYMARGAYLTDSVMRFFGLPGQSLISMIIGFGCTVPAILSSRNLSNKYERILTITAVPFITCSARLSIYIVFVAIFFTKFKTLTIFSLYLIGIFVAVSSVWFFKKTLFSGKESYFILELPKYRMPSLRFLLKISIFKVSSFMFKRSTKVILPIIIVFNIFFFINENTNLKNMPVFTKPLRVIQSIVSPMGIDKDNPEATGALVGGLIAKEIVIASLQNFYHLTSNDAPEESIADQFKNSLFNLKDSFNSLYKSLIFKDSFSTNYSAIKSLGDVMLKKFHNMAAPFAYLIFTLLYTPCVITLGAIRKEIGDRWMIMINVWNLIVAYTFATSFYQGYLLLQNPNLFSFIWIIACILVFVITFFVLKNSSLKDKLLA